MPAEQGGSLLITVGYLVFFVVIMYLLIFLPQKRRDKKAKAMLDAIPLLRSAVFPARSSISRTMR